MPISWRTKDDSARGLGQKGGGADVPQAYQPSASNWTRRTADYHYQWAGELKNPAGGAFKGRPGGYLGYRCVRRSSVELVHSKQTVGVSILAGVNAGSPAQRP